MPKKRTRTTQERLIEWALAVDLTTLRSTRETLARSAEDAQAQLRIVEAALARREESAPSLRLPLDWDGDGRPKEER